MRILLVAHRFWPHVGGTEHAVQALAVAFRRADHEVTVATSHEPGTALSEDLDGVRVRRFGLRRLGRYRLPPPAYARFVLDGPWDVVHLHGQRVWSSDHLYRHLARRRPPIVITLHGLYQLHMEPGPLSALYYRLLLPRALRRVDRVIALTAGEEEELRRLGVGDETLLRIPDGIDLTEFADGGASPDGFRARHGLSAEDRVLVAPGGFYPNKRIDRLIEAVACLDRADVALVHLGPTGDRRLEGECRALARRRGVRARFAGVVPRGELLAAFRAADLLVSAADFEGFGLTLLEAMAAGLPFVSTPVGAAAELSATGAGRVVSPAPPAIARAMAELLDAPDTRREMARRGRASIPAYAIERVARQHLELYAQAGGMPAHRA